MPFMVATNYKGPRKEAIPILGPKEKNHEKGGPHDDFIFR